ncbi:hypothetical protein [Flavobacterium psychrotolerans]|nr:hypothetical protein [Flavobacterium psychrotolerans]
MKNKYLLVTILVMSCLVTFGFIKNCNNLKVSKTQSISPEQEILGVWIMENEQNNKREFTNDGHVKTYINNILESDDLYSISNECGGETLSNGDLILKIIDGNDQSEYCEYINGINENNSNILSLTPVGRMETIIYLKQQ